MRLAIIGCGSMAGYHAPLLTAVPDIQITFCCDLVADKARALAETVGAGASTDFREALDAADAVWVCTEPFNRVEIVTAAAEAGKDIFTEKPIALNLADADTMIAAARKAGVIYMLGYCLRFWQPYRLVHDTFASGRLGDLVTCWTRRYMPADFRGSWYGKQDLSGGVALDFGSHDIDWLSWIGGPVASVFARTMRVRPNAQADEHVQCMLMFASGGTAQTDVTWWDAVNESSLGVVGTKGSMVVDRAGVVKEQLVGGDEVTIDVASAMAVDPTGHVGQRDDDGQIQCVAAEGETIHEHFVRCVRGRLAPQTDAAIGREVLRVVLAVRESAETNQVVHLS